MKRVSTMTSSTFARMLRASVAAATLLGAASLAMPAQAEEMPFSITVDGHKIDGSGNVQTKALEATAANAALQAVDIQVKFDGLGARPVLNVSTMPPQVNFKPGDNLRFLASFNYPAFISQAEIRLYDSHDDARSTPYQIIPVSKLGAAEWQLPSDAPAEMLYVLRVYDQEGRYDETRPLKFNRADAALPKEKTAEAAIAPGYGEDRTAFRNIPVYGGAITVYGSNIPEGHDVTVAGEPVPVDGENKFVVQRIIPSGNHKVDVAVLKDGLGLEFSRDVTVPENEWFYVALADFTLGHNFGGIVEHTSADEFDGTWTKGRMAFYLKGKIKGQYILTASADTGEGSLRNMFEGLGGKSPQDVLRHIDPNTYYPVYGDDSTALEDAPTRGKFYVRLEDGPSSIMWGNFHSNISGTHFLRNERSLYGASGVYRSNGVTKDGEAHVGVDAYAALPGTEPQNDVFRGTGGSAYFLKHQLINVGSDVICIEQRNAITGFVVQRTRLVYKTDYDFDYTNGVLILRSPLASTTSSGDENYVVAHYEYEPAAGDINGYVTGGRAQVWAGDHVRAGVTGLQEKTAGADQNMVAADLRIQKSKDTYIEAEAAHSQGPGVGYSYSADGGLSLQNNASAGAVGKPANAWRVEAGTKLDELTDGRVKGQVGARYEHYDAGFSSLDVQAPQAKNLWAVTTDLKAGESATVHGSYNDLAIDTGEHNRQGDVSVAIQTSPMWTVQPYGRYTEKTGSTVANAEQGQRGDVGAKLIYNGDNNTQAYVFGQGTVAHSGTLLIDNRLGIGAKKKITDRITASGEISEGTQGVDVTAALSYEPSADNRYYLGYRLDAFRKSSSSYTYTLEGSDLGTIVMGSRHHFNDEWLAYGEDNFDLFGERRAVTQTYGVSYTPTPHWTMDSAVEVGRVYDNTINPSTGLKNVNLNRQAFSAGVGYRDSDHGIDGKLKGEARWDGADDGSSELMSYLIQAGFGVKMSQDWRALGKLDVVLTDASDVTHDGKYVEGSMGFAYRGTDSDRFNMLAKYTFLYDEPGAAQVGVDGTTASPSQISNIFSVDATYDLTQKLSIGGKYGLRIGEMRDRKPGATWDGASAHLGIVRADYHIVNEWDAVLEARALWSPTSGTTDFGLVAALYKQLGDNFKMGIGYNFGSFSDDLRDVVHDNQGVFINLIGKF